MEEAASETSNEHDLAKRRVPCLIAYLHPFRLIEGETLTKWETTLEEVNNQSWNYAALHEIAGGIEVGLPAPYHLVVSRDGALALPPLEHLRSHQTVVEFFNRCLAGLLLGGVYCEAITPDGLDVGSVIDWRYVRSHKFGLAAPNRFHEQIRMRQASSLEAISLLAPRTISMSELTNAMRIGLGLLDRLKTLRGEFLLKGVTAFARRDWGTALANLWIAIEQITSMLWQREIVEPSLEIDPSNQRRNQLNDTRTWTVSVRHELLFQKKAITLDTFKALGRVDKVDSQIS